MVLSIIDIIVLIGVNFLIVKSNDLAAVSGIIIMVVLLAIHIIYEAMLR